MGRAKKIPINSTQNLPFDDQTLRNAAWKGGHKKLAVSSLTGNSSFAQLEFSHKQQIPLVTNFQRIKKDQNARSTSGDHSSSIINFHQ